MTRRYTVKKPLSSSPSLSVLLLLCVATCTILVVVSTINGVYGSQEVDATLRRTVGDNVQSHVVDTKTGRTGVFSLKPGETKIKNDGQYALSSANGLMWHDVNGNGIPDEANLAQIGLAGESVEIYFSNGTMREGGATKVDGRFSFKVDPDNYYVIAHCPVGFVHSPSSFAPSLVSDLELDRSPVFEVEASKAVTGLNWGCYKPPMVAGVVFMDNNVDAVQQNEEPGVPEIEVRLSLATDSSFSKVMKTDEEGRFSFSNLRPGEYALHIYIPNEYHYHPPLGSLHKFSLITLSDGTRRTGTTPQPMGKPLIVENRIAEHKDVALFFGLLSGDSAFVDLGIYTLSRVVGKVFEDINADGIWNPREKVLPNVEVTLYKTPSEFVSSMLSDEDGDYAFIDLVPGDYYVSFDLSSPDYKHSKARAGSSSSSSRRDEL